MNEKKAATAAPTDPANMKTIITTAAGAMPKQVEHLQQAHTFFV